MSFSDPHEGEVIATIKVYNDAPESSDGGNIVFVGVGLRIIDNGEGDDKDSIYWAKRIKKTRSSDITELRQQYNEGIWFGAGGNESPFPDVTQDEKSHGEALFPGETVIFDMEISEADLPYLDIRVEASVSRRHLYQKSESMYELRKWSQPLINEVFHKVDKIDFFTPIVTIASGVPVLGPHTKLADIDRLRELMRRAITIISEFRDKLNEIYRSNRHKKMRDYIKKDILQYLTSVEKAFETTLEVLSSGNIYNINQAAAEMRSKISDETAAIKRQRAELIAELGIDA